MEIIHCLFPYPQQILVLFFESLKYNLPYDIIRYIWYFYKHIEPHFIKNMTTEIQTQYYVTYILSLKNECFYQSGPLNLKISLLYSCEDISYFNIKIIKNKNNNNFMNFIETIDNYFDSIKGRNTIFDNDIDKMKYNYYSCVYKYTKHFQMECQMNKQLLEDNHLKTLENADILFRICSVKIPYQHFINNNVYHPIFEVLSIKKIEI